MSQPPRPRGRDELARRRSQQVGAVGVTLAAALPVLLWHELVLDIASEFRIEFQYLVVGWMPWTLMFLGLLCFIPIAVAELRDRERRFYRAGGGAWFGWGVSLYLLGFALATQVAQIADSLAV